MKLEEIRARYARLLESDYCDQDLAIKMASEDVPALLQAFETFSKALLEVSGSTTPGQSRHIEGLLRKAGVIP